MISRIETGRGKSVGREKRTGELCGLFHFDAVKHGVLILTSSLFLDRFKEETFARGEFCYQGRRANGNENNEKSHVDAVM